MSDIYETLSNRDEAAYSFREIMEFSIFANASSNRSLDLVLRAIDLSQDRILEEDHAKIAGFLTDPSNAPYLKDPASVSTIDFREWAVAATSAGFTELQRHVSLSALVLAHSYLEEMLCQLLRTIWMWDPKVVVDRVLAGKSLQIDAELLGGGIPAILQAKFENYTNEFYRLPLLKKVVVMLNLSKEGERRPLTNGYMYDQEELQRVDSLRHDLVHKRAIPYSASQAKRDIEFLSGTGFWLLVQVGDARQFETALRPGTKVGDMLAKKA